MKEIGEAIQTLNEVIPPSNSPMVDMAHIHIAAAWERVKQELERKAATERKGKWIESDFVGEDFKTCSLCHCGKMAYDIEKLLFNYCPWCGADMRER